MLPEQFVVRMQQMLKDEYTQFEKSYEKEEFHALRLNPLKNKSGDAHTFQEWMPWQLRQVPWCDTGFYYNSEDRPGKHLYHEAGAYYIQEPSAMTPATFLDVKPGQRVLDLCAAPGGKSSQIAGMMQGEGILFSNEIHPARAAILSENMERMGVKNVIVVNETSGHLAEFFQNYFHRIMVDAPCSGEGMFRKNEEAKVEWSEENVQLCAERQDEILDNAYTMLMPGGRMVYSTCTFAPAENEGSISRFLKRHTDMYLVPVAKTPEMSDGVAEWAEENVEGMEHTIRLWPHKLDGEGHYVAVLEKKQLQEQHLQEEHNGDLLEHAEHQQDEFAYTGYCKNKEERGKKWSEYPELESFVKETLRVELEGALIAFGDQLYLLPKGAPQLKGLKVIRPGLHLGTNKKNRFEPGHALALALSSEEVAHAVNLKESDVIAHQYVNGMTFQMEGEKGWYLISVDGYSIGWGKLAGGTMKNHYPKGLRKVL